VAERGEAFVSDSQGRDHVSRAELALDSDGGFLAIRVRTTANLGAYLTAHGPSSPTLYSAPMMTGAYDIPAVSISVDGVYTNTVPVDVYRGVGRAEATYVVERLVDAAARELGVEPAELRRRNYVPRSAMPYTTATGLSFDSADFAHNMDDVMRYAGWQGLAQRRDDARDRGRLRGIGMSSYFEACGGDDEEEAAIVFEPDGGIAVHVGTQSSGQGHATAFAQIVEQRLGVAFESIRLVQGDTDVVPFGVGTVASRSLALCGSAIAVAADNVVAKATKIAAQLLEAAAVDITFADGVFTVAGTDRSVTLAELAAAANEPATAAAAGVEPGLDERVRYRAEASTFPSGCHVCEVEVDADTGTVEIVGYTAVDDFGRVVNPLIVEGQVHGGVAQGIGQALLENTVYDDASGQLLSGSLMDYCLPRADDLPAFALTRNETPCTANALGIKGCGEAGAIGAPPAVINAILDALAELGVRDIDMPATPERVWRAIRQTGRIMESQA
jgi:carbon-monoxide dehydrogenase large subunit